MSKNLKTRTISKKPNDNTSPKSVNQDFAAAKNPDWGFSLIITFIYLILGIWGAMHHESWRDEFQAWLIAQNSHSISELFHNIRHEGHPAIWHLLLYGLSRFSSSLMSMKILHVCIATAAVFIINSFAPLSRTAKTLFSFGYFIFYEYLLVNRPYAGGMLFLFAFCSLYALYVSKRHTYLLLLIGIDLFLLSNTSIFGVMFCLALLLFLSIESLSGNLKEIFQKKDIGIICLSLGLAFAGLIVAIYQIRPPLDNNFPLQYASGYDLKRLKYALTKICITYFPIPKMGVVNSWNTSVFLKDTKEYMVFLSVLLMAVFAYIFQKRRAVLILYLSGTAGLLAFNYYTLQFGARYTGHFFLLLMASYWLYYIGKDSGKGKREQDSKSNKVKPVSGHGRIALLSMYIILIVNLFAGIYMYYMDIKYPFSNMDALGKYILENKLDTLKMAGTTDYLASPVSYFTRKPIYFPESKTEGYFISWDKKRLDGKLAIPEVFKQLVPMALKNGKILLILSPELKVLKDGNPAAFEEGDIAEGVKMRNIAKIDKDCMEETEKYYLYLIERK